MGQMNPISSANWKRTSCRRKRHPTKLTLYLALLWAVWHLPDHFAEEGWGVEALISAPVVFAIEVVSLFFARALFVWFYNMTRSSVLLVAATYVLINLATDTLYLYLDPRLRYA